MKHKHKWTVNKRVSWCKGCGRRSIRGKRTLNQAFGKPKILWGESQHA